jgi:hypothetical protein
LLEHKSDGEWSLLTDVLVPDPRGDESEAVTMAESMWSKALDFAEEQGGVIEFRIGVRLRKGATKYCARAGRIDIGGAAPKIIHSEPDGGVGILKAHANATSTWAAALQSRDASYEKLADVIVRLADKLAGIMERTASMFERSAGVDAEVMRAKFDLDREVVRSNAFVSATQLETDLRARRMERAASMAEKFAPAMIPSVIAWLEQEARKAAASTAEATASQWRLLSAAVRAAGKPELAELIAGCKRGDEERVAAREVLNTWSEPIRADAGSPDLLADIQRWARWVLAAAQS